LNERTAIIADGVQIDAEQLLPNAHRKNVNSDSEAATPFLDDYFIRFVRENQQKMTEIKRAKPLGINRNSLWERRHKFGIPKKCYF